MLMQRTPLGAVREFGLSSSERVTPLPLTHLCSSPQRFTLHKRQDVGDQLLHLQRIPCIMAPPFGLHDIFDLEDSKILICLHLPASHGMRCSDQEMSQVLSLTFLRGKEAGLTGLLSRILGFLSPSARPGMEESVGTLNCQIQIYSQHENKHTT